MALNNAGLLHGRECSFLRVARVDMTAPDTLTHVERMLVLRHNIGWEHHLLNFTNFVQLLASIEHFVTDLTHVEMLFELPSRWPWMMPPSATDIIGNLSVNDLHTRWYQWREKHDFLYEEP
jgi:hypothetical protein